MRGWAVGVGGGGGCRSFRRQRSCEPLIRDEDPRTLLMLIAFT